MEFEKLKQIIVEVLNVDESEITLSHCFASAVARYHAIIIFT